MFIGQQIDAREIGRRLDARYLVEGTLQRVDDRLRITAQLVDAQTGLQLRSLRFDRRIGDIFELQDDIPAAQLAATLQVQLLGADMHRVDRSRNTSLDAYLSYLDAQERLNRWTVADAEQGIIDLEHAIKIDPTFALAYAELARARHLHDWLRTGENAGRTDVLPLLDKALALDPHLGEAYAMRGFLQADFKAADADFRKAIELAPNYGPGYQMYAETLWEEPGHTQDAKAMIEQAIAIDPIAPRNYYIEARILGEDEGALGTSRGVLRESTCSWPGVPAGNCSFGRIDME